MIFDEINTTLEEVDRLSFPGEEAGQRRFLALEFERDDLRDSLANFEASLREIEALRSQAEENRAPLESREIAHRIEIARLSEIGETKLQLEANLRAANEQISSLNSVVEGLNGRISSMLASRSWQITAPLRVLQRWILGR